MSISFSLPTESYKRDVDPLGHYLHQAATYLSIQTGDSYQQCYQWVKHSLETKSFPGVEDPTVVYYERDENGDRHKQQSKLTDYLYSTISSNDILAPTMTSYLNPKKKPSLLVEFIEYNVKSRSIAKKAGFKAREAGDLFTYELKNSEQNNAKIANNSISGAHVTASNPLYCKSSHSTLTSITRVSSSSGNVNNERLIAGNRHYYNYDVTLNNITSIISNTDYNLLDKVMEKHNLYYPTANDALKVITYSSRHYWRNTRLERNLLNYLERLTPLQRAAFVYTGDFYHIRLFNETFMRTFLESLGDVTNDPVDDPLALVRTIDEEVLNLSHLLCSNLVKGLGKEYEKMNELGVLNTLVSTCLNIEKTLSEYKEFLAIIFLTKNVPNSLSALPTMYRKAAIISDTDSTIFTTQDWNKWYNNGSYNFNEKAERVGHCLTYLSTASLSHNLAIASANMGMEGKRIRTMQMKSEFYFPVMVPASGPGGAITKHYFASIAAQEGNIREKPDYEIKGVHLKSSSAPKEIINDAQDMMKFILNEVMENRNISITQMLKRVADKERMVIDAIKSGNTSYLRRSKVKTANAYADSNEDKTPYSRHKFWVEVFEPKYGKITPPPYSVVKIPTILDNKKALENWISNIRDSDLAKRLQNWLVNNAKKDLPTLYLSTEFARGRGLPEEMTMIVDYKKIIRDIFSAHYIVLGSLGYYKTIDSVISDYY